MIARRCAGDSLRPGSLVGGKELRVFKGVPASFRSVVTVFCRCFLMKSGTILDEKWAFHCSGHCV